jgi:3-deoxy-D-manno-octulosonic-acid transferase
MIALFLYTLATIVLSPIIFVWVLIRIIRHKEDISRINERLGYSKRMRPEGRLIWLHGASVGECLSMMPLINEILRRDVNAHVMVTSGTRTSASLMAKRLPDRAFHQYIPIDLPWLTRRFVKYWNADLVLWFESDFWPNILKSIAKSKKPLVLLNGRISDRSFNRWRKARFFIKPLLGLFTLCFGQTNEDVSRLEFLGAKQVVCAGNLKFSAVNPPYDAVELNELLNERMILYLIITYFHLNHIMDHQMD